MALNCTSIEQKPNKCNISHLEVGSGGEMYAEMKSTPKNRDLIVVILFRNFLASLLQLCERTY